MNKTVQETEDFIAEIKKRELPVDREILIASSYTLLHTLVSTSKNAHILCAAQDMFYEEQGAFTGEVSPLQLLDIGCTHVLIGHSERRHIFGEDNDLANHKLKAAQQHGIIPIYCVGETLAERKAEKAQDIVENQIKRGLEELSQEFIERLIIAYEPVWAIGTGETATPEQAEEMHAFIRTLIPEKTRVLYGGSVKPGNAEELMKKPSIDGFLIGGASLDVEDFYQIISVKIEKG